MTELMQRVAKKPASYTYIVFEEVKSEQIIIGLTLITYMKV